LIAVIAPPAGELGEDAGRHAGGELLRREPVPAAGHGRHDLAPARRVRLRQGREHVQEQRLAQRSRLLGAVEHRHSPGAGRQRGEQRLRRERPVQADLDDPHLLAAGGQVPGSAGGGLPPDPIRTMTRSACGWPWYSMSR
jgi:hypothetical protein